MMSTNTLDEVDEVYSIFNKIFNPLMTEAVIWLDWLTEAVRLVSI